MILLQSQSNKKFELLKDSNSLYYIKRTKDKKTALIGDRDEAENFILYGIYENKEELKTLIFN